MRDLPYTKNVLNDQIKFIEQIAEPFKDTDVPEIKKYRQKLLDVCESLKILKCEFENAADFMDRFIKYDREF